MTWLLALGFLLLWTAALVVTCRVLHAGTNEDTARLAAFYEWRKRQRFEQWRESQRRRV